MCPESKLFVNCGQTLRTCFVTQNTSEHLFTGLTAEQSLRYAIKFQNSRKELSFLSISLKIDEMLNQFLIKSCAKTRVESCSGGEQKRIAIACELMASNKPNLLCIDEPTSGLDSSAARVVIRCLKALTARHGISIVVSIHQPNNELLTMFDNIHVLAAGGLDVYEGAPDRLIDRLNECGVDCKDQDLAITCVNRLLTLCSLVNDYRIDRLNEKQRSLRAFVSQLTTDTKMDSVSNATLKRTKCFQFRGNRMKCGFQGSEKVETI